MKTKTYTISQLATMPRHQIDMIVKCIEYNTYRLIGIAYKKYVHVYQDVIGNIVFKYE